MRHRRKTHRLSRNTANRKALLRSLARSLFIHEQIRTTLKKAKAASALADKLISLGKAGTITAKKNAIGILGSKELIEKIFGDIAPRFAGRKGGYTRVLHLSSRRGDGADTAILELTERKITEKKTKAKTKDAAKEEKKPAAHIKKEEKAHPPAEKEKPHIQPKTIAAVKEKTEEGRAKEKQGKFQYGFLKNLRSYFRRKSG